MKSVLVRVLFIGIVVLCLIGMASAPTGVTAQGAATVSATMAATQAGTLAAADLPVCGNLVADAQALIAKQCGSTGRNKVCYGNISLKADPQPGIEGFKFSEPGDTVNALDIKQLELSSLDVNSGTWGMAMMRVQADLPDTAAGQNVTVLLFGNVNIQNAFVPPTQKLDVTAPKATNVSKLPGGALVGKLAANDTVSATGRLKDASWLRVVLPGKDGKPDVNGWVYAKSVTVSGDVSTLDVVDTRAPVYGPMQAFYFRAGVGEAACKGAPPNGILIQTPKGAGRLNLVVNDVKIALGSTVYLQAQPSKEFIVNTVEGSARVTAANVTQIAVAGTRVRVPLDANLKASGAPLPPEPYVAADLQNLPISSLPVTVAIAAPLKPSIPVNTNTSAAAPGTTGNAGIPNDLLAQACAAARDLQDAAAIAKYC